MKFRKFTVIYLLSIILIGLVLVILFLKKEERKKKHGHLEEFSYREVDKYMNSTRNLPDYDNYVILLFNPGCEGCQAEAEIILDNIDSFDKSCVLFPSPDSLDRIETFMMNYQLYGKENVLYGQVDMDTIKNKFGVSAIPWSFIYDYNKKLLKSGLAVTHADIKKYLLKE
jgi:thiol-disulfide isomerase/thioredoxin